MDFNADFLDFCGCVLPLFCGDADCVLAFSALFAVAGLFLFSAVFETGLITALIPLTVSTLNVGTSRNAIDTSALFPMRVSDTETNETLVYCPPLVLTVSNY